MNADLRAALLLNSCTCDRSRVPDDDRHDRWVTWWTDPACAEHGYLINDAWKGIGHDTH